MSNPDKYRPNPNYPVGLLAVAALLGTAACGPQTAAPEMTVVPRYAFLTVDAGWPHLNFCSVSSSQSIVPQVYGRNEAPTSYPYQRIVREENGLTVTDAVQKTFPEVIGSDDPALFTRNASSSTNWGQQWWPTKLEGKPVSLVCAAGYGSNQPNTPRDSLMDFPVANDTRKVQDLPEGTVVEVTFDNSTQVAHDLVQVADTAPTDIDSHIKTVSVLYQ